MKTELYKTKEEIERWLKKYNIIDYELIENSEYGYVVNSNKNVILSNMYMSNIFVKFNVINGIFDCSNNRLTSLKGCPEIVDSIFNCSDNNLNSLQYAPKLVKGHFVCSHNHLTTLKGCTKIIEDSFICNNNKLIDLKYCPEFVEQIFDVSFNNLNSLEFFPLKVRGICYLNSNFELKELQNIKFFVELSKISNVIYLNKKLEQEISIDNSIKNDKIKL